MFMLVDASKSLIQYLVQVWVNIYGVDVRVKESL